MTFLERLTEVSQDRQLLAVRVLNASKDSVFEAWTNPIHMARWWGPEGFTNSFEIFEPVEDGQWKYTMHGPQGGNYPNESRFLEVTHDRIIIQHVSRPHFHLVASFEATGDKRTRITFRQVFPTAEDCEKVRSFAVEANEQNLDRLETVLQQMTRGKKLSLTMIFDVSPEKLFAAWTNRELLKTWWGPHGFTNPVCEVDAVAGGKLLIHMRSPDGMIFPIHGHIQSVERPTQLVFTTSGFEDEHGSDQLESLITVSFNELMGITELNLQVMVLKSNHIADAALDALEEGWRQSLEKLGSVVRPL